MVFSGRTAPRTLSDSIRQLQNTSAGFCRSWAEGDHQGAGAITEDAFKSLDHIQNELLRHRDEHKEAGTWKGSELEAAMTQIVGAFVEGITSAEEQAFIRLPPGEGTFVSAQTRKDLPLMAALNKLKHRAGTAINFDIPPDGRHILYVLTRGGMGKASSICQIDVGVLCASCHAAERAL
jgi:hypothetical protein